MQKTVIFYNQDEVIEDSTAQIEPKKGYKLWVDVIDPEKHEITEIQEMFNLDLKAVEKVQQKSKMPQVKTLDKNSPFFWT
jgi:Mg2+ and Co2+ transporter CorA